ncbi:hypothetical protein HDV06_001482 [Boothiomyces sp. JEL0866]|nr:hypothetical protein HDV06_001482 [Boothiomyces sp. JEL0866]
MSEPENEVIGSEPENEVIDSFKKYIEKETKIRALAGKNATMNAILRYSKEMDKKEDEMVKDVKSLLAYLEVRYENSETRRKNLTYVLHFMRYSYEFAKTTTAEQLEIIEKAHKDLCDEINGKSTKEIIEQEQKEKNDKKDDKKEEDIPKLSEVKKKFLEVRDSIENPNEKLWLSLLLMYDETLRGDLMDVMMIKQEDNGIPYYDTETKSIKFLVKNLKKSKDKIDEPNNDELEKLGVFEWKLNDSEISLLPESDYLLDFGSNQRSSKEYTTRLQNLTEKYLGEEFKFSTKILRKMKARDAVEGIDSDFKEKYFKLKERARKHNHSLETMLIRYVE